MNEKPFGLVRISFIVLGPSTYTKTKGLALIWITIIIILINIIHSPSWSTSIFLQIFKTKFWRIIDDSCAILVDCVNDLTVYKNINFCFENNFFFMIFALKGVFVDVNDR